MKNHLICILLLLLTALPAIGQLPGGVSNHPGLDWKVAETENFKIIFPERISGIEVEAAAIAEETYAVLSRLLNVEIPEKVRIYLSDEDEITNGYAVPVGYGFTKIWVHLNDPVNTWTGESKWLRRVIAHELVHIFHFNAVRTSLGLLAYSISNPTPSFWAEGLAQYLSEPWDTFRGEQWLRIAAFENALNYSDGNSIWNGRLMYAYGNSQARFFAEQYGDSTLAEMLAHRKSALLGLASVHDFGTAFRETTGETYSDFRERWGKHIRVHYNTLAGQMERSDSLGSETIDYPGTYLDAVKVSPDSTNTASLSIRSVRLPYRALHIQNHETGKLILVAEGLIQNQITWNEDGTRLLFSRRTTGEGRALLYDIYEYNLTDRRLIRLTHSRRAHYPAYLDDNRILFVGSDAGTGNLFIFDRAAGTETPVTNFSGDVQLAHIAVQPGKETAAVSRFAADGTRDIILMDIESGSFRSLTSGLSDDRRPVWSPDGEILAYTSLRDNVPNIFMRDEKDAFQHERRVTNIFTGAVLHDWPGPASAEKLIVETTESKKKDEIRLVSAVRVPWKADELHQPVQYKSWTNITPTEIIKDVIEPDESLISGRYSYSSWNNLTHIVTFPFPFFFSSDSWGAGISSLWFEPLGKHAAFGIAGISIPETENQSFFFLSYMNSQLRPDLYINLYKRSLSGQFYDRGFLLNINTGGEIGFRYPLNLFDREFRTSDFNMRLRAYHTEPERAVMLSDLPPGLPAPVTGRQTDLRVSFVISENKPDLGNLIHPLQAWGVRARLTGSARLLYSDTRFLKPELSAYAVIPVIGKTRLYMYGRGIMLLGDDFPQNFVGLTRYDDISVDLPFDPGDLLGTDSERVRGYRNYVGGNRFVFLSAEYRIPVLPTLWTTIFNLVSLGETVVAPFVDAGFVWNTVSTDERFSYVRQVGTGAEIKNLLRLGPARLVHSFGFGQPLESALGPDIDWYYRVRATVPF